MLNKSIILLSGGLDSLVSLGLTKEEYNVSLALTFDYGQKSAKQEINSSKLICDYYNIEHKIIELNWLKDVTQNAITGYDNLPIGIQKSSESVWVPNRNGLFLNIAASFADGLGYNHIIFGANKEEAKNFSDNTQDFINSINNEFKFSTSKEISVITPLINCDKNDIVRLALTNKLPLEYVYSCYDNFEKNCGKCESCTRLKNALIANEDEKYIKVLFK